MASSSPIKPFRDRSLSVNILSVCLSLAIFFYFGLSSRDKGRWSIYVFISLFVVDFANIISSLFLSLHLYLDLPISVYLPSVLAKV